ncbi:translocation protein S66 [Dinochytrium kinnereticum]|nr:translocation protein S66 [Dinochytrium kinnereticum]
MQSSANAVWALLGFLTLILLLRTTVLKRIKAASASAKSKPGGYFPPHLQKNQYEELAEMYSPEDEAGLKILTSALVRRAMVDVQRIWQIREEKPSLQNLVRTGVLGEEMMEKITLAEKELEVEVQDIMTEADLYKAGWGKTIFQEATQFIQLQTQQLQKAAAAQQKHQHQHQATSPTGSAGSAKPESEMSKEELEERARKAAEDLLLEEEREKAKSEQRAKSAKAKGKPVAAKKK